MNRRNRKFTWHLKTIALISVHIFLVETALAAPAGQILRDGHDGKEYLFVPSPLGERATALYPTWYRTPSSSLALQSILQQSEIDVRGRITFEGCVEVVTGLMSDTRKVAQFGVVFALPLADEEEYFKPLEGMTVAEEQVWYVTEEQIVADLYHEAQKPLESAKERFKELVAQVEREGVGEANQGEIIALLGEINEALEAVTGAFDQALSRTVEGSILWHELFHLKSNYAIMYARSFDLVHDDVADSLFADAPEDILYQKVGFLYKTDLLIQILTSGHLLPMNMPADIKSPEIMLWNMASFTTIHALQSELATIETILDTWSQLEFAQEAGLEMMAEERERLAGEIAVLSGQWNQLCYSVYDTAGMKTRLADIDESIDKAMELYRTTFRLLSNMELYSSYLADNTALADAPFFETSSVIKTAISNAQRLLCDSMTGEQILDKKEVNLAAILSERVEYSRRLETANNITIQEDYSEELTIVVDERKIHEVIDNLIGNAADAMPEGGTITISAKATGTSAVITVSDTGMGMLSSIVDMFNSGVIREGRGIGDKLTSKKKVAGHGFGLHIVCRIIEALGGTVSVESEVGKGTTFTITLPLGLPEAHELADTEALLREQL